MNDMTAAEGGLFAGPNVVSRIAEDGTIYLSSGYTLPVASGRVTDWLVDGADAHPDRVFLAEHMGDGWRSVTYAQALARAETLGAWLLEQTKGKDGPVLALSENAVDLGLLTLASFHVGIPIATISTAYSLISSDHAKLKAMVTLLDPAVVFVSSTATYAKALAAIAPHHSGVLLASKTDGDLDATLFENASRDDKDAVARANAAKWANAAGSRPACGRGTIRSASRDRFSKTAGCSGVGTGTSIDANGSGSAGLSANCGASTSTNSLGRSGPDAAADIPRRMPGRTRPPAIPDRTHETPPNPTRPRSLRGDSSAGLRLAVGARPHRHPRCVRHATVHSFRRSVSGADRPG